ncbi:MAG TPA: DNA replication/repair protein RecF [Ohtaekwangia sp.]|uniref:DNA replication/repair protein RecF n=1 Tax=Ohtaekwangia sp. TaxID=2066019 RepID=UPI002F95E192
MYLDELHLLNFKNYQEANVRFSPSVNVLVGKNGSGKTNLLDAIYSLSFTKSAFASSDAQCIMIGQPFFMIKGKFNKAGKFYELMSSVQTGTKKTFREEGADYQKLSDHIGKYPVVLIAPDDVELVRESSEARRKFFDSIISQLDKTYLEALMQYNQALKQRNSLLRMFQERGTPDWLALESYDQILIRVGKLIYTRRFSFAEEFLPVFRKYFQYIVGEDEVTDLEYASELKDKSFEEGLIKNRQKDVMLQRTSFGIHRDDYLFTLGNGDLKKLGSQGQQKSFVIALKLAQFEIVQRAKGFKPILLLDDIFDKLDDFRIAKLLELMKSELGQLFITDARPDRTGELLRSIQVPAFVFSVNKGDVTPVNNSVSS